MRFASPWTGISEEEILFVNMMLEAYGLRSPYALAQSQPSKELKRTSDG